MWTKLTDTSNYKYELDFILLRITTSVTIITTQASVHIATSFTSHGQSGEAVF